MYFIIPFGSSFLFINKHVKRRICPVKQQARNLDSYVVYSKMGDEQPSTPVVVLPADVPEAPPPPPAVAAAVAEENPPGTAVVAPQAGVNFSLVICCLFGSATLSVSLVFPSPFLGNFSVVDEFVTPRVLFLDYRL